MGSPSSLSTCGWPSRKMATSLLVVPRSMPIIVSMFDPLHTRKRSVPSDAHLGEAEHPPVPQVAAADLLDDRAGRPATVANRLQHLHPIGVEGLSHGRDRRQPVLAQCAFDAL